MSKHVNNQVLGVEPVGLGQLGDVSNLNRKTGFLKRVEVRLDTSRAAADALKIVEREKVQAEANVALTAMKLAEVSLRTSLVSNAMPQIGALATRVNAATASVDQALTNGSTAEVFTHISNRAKNLSLVDELGMAGKVTIDEAGIIKSFAEADAAEDIARSRQRMLEAKVAVDTLHSFALQGIAKAKDLLKS